MSTHTEVAPTKRPRTAEYKEALEKLTTSEAQELHLDDEMGKALVAGNDDLANEFQARLLAARSQTEMARRRVQMLRPLAAIEEQAAIRADQLAAFEKRKENQRRAAEAQAHYDDLVRLLKEAETQVHYWRHIASDGVFTCGLRLQRHLAEHGDLSGG